MARNEEKHYGRLNRIYLMKEKEEYEKANPKRPRLDTLYTPEEIQEWLPSIKKDIDFYLKKSQVTCYSDAHIDDCKKQVVKLENEFKAFVRKIKQLAPSPLEAIPWTNRPYKRKESMISKNPDEVSCTEFKRIATPILEEKNDSGDRTSQYSEVNSCLMDQPLSFSTKFTKNENIGEKEINSSVNMSNFCTARSKLGSSDKLISLDNQSIKKNSLKYFTDKSDKEKNYQSKQNGNIVDYDSSENESS